MAESFISDFRLMWYLDELNRLEFAKFKELLRQEASERGLKPIPLEVRKAKRQSLASLMIKHYGEQPAWELAFSIFPKLYRMDLCDKARRECAEYTYRAHIKKKFTSMWSRDSFTDIPGSFDHTLTQEEGASLETYFTPKATRRAPTVVLHGLPRTGKTRLLMKLVLAWSDGTLYRDRFSFIFYFCCRELKQLTATSLAGLISREKPDCVPMAEIIAQPERLLFIIDSFEELRCTLREPESELCSDWREERSVKAVLGSLLRRRVFLESALLLGAMPERPPDLEHRLEHPTMQVVTGFHENHRKQYFCCAFEDRGQALEAFSLVRSNELLFSMCGVPLLCWMVCACLRREMASGGDLAATCCRSTSVFLSFIFHLFTPQGAGHPSHHGQRQLRALYSLAAEGMWTDLWVFGEEELRRNGVAAEDVPALLDLRLFRKYSESGNSYSFIHPCVQEFCAAVFHLLDSPAGHPSPAVGCTEALLLTFLKKERASWVFVGCYLLGFVGESEKRLDALLGTQRSSEKQLKVLRCLRSLVEQEEVRHQLELVLLFYGLFEMHSDSFARHVMDTFSEARCTIREYPDLAISAYCLKHCSSLREFIVSVPQVLREERGPDPMSSRPLLWWRQICSVLTTNEHLQVFRVVDSILGRCAVFTLCSQLKQSGCPVQRLETSSFSLCCEIWIFFEVLISNPNLKHLTLSHTQLDHDDVAFLFSALNHPLCNIQELVLQDSGFSADDCNILATMLVRNGKLKLLDLRENHLDMGMPALCMGLSHPECSVQILVLAACGLSARSCSLLSEALLSNRNLSHLDLSRNALRDEGVAVLCEVLRQPTCRLQSLSLQGCWITSRGCHHLASVLASNPNLRKLEIGSNYIGDAGVQLLSRALLHPLCSLNNLRLNSCHLTGACCPVLASVIARSQTLYGLDLTGNILDQSGIMLLRDTVRQPGCVLQMLRMSKAAPSDRAWMLMTVESATLSVVTMEE